MKRDWFMQHLMMIAYPKVAVIAVENRTLDGSLEQAVKKALEEEQDGIFAPYAKELLAQFEGDILKAVEAIVSSIPFSQPYQIDIVDPSPFVLTKDFQLGIATESATASFTWLRSPEEFSKVMGRKFSWIAPDGKQHIDDKTFFRHPSAVQIERLMTPNIIKRAIEMGFVRIRK